MATTTRGSAPQQRVRKTAAVQQPTFEEKIKLLEKKVAEFEKQENLRNTPAQHLPNLKLAPPTWTPWQRGAMWTLFHVVVAFILALITSLIMLAIGLGNTEYYTPWWDVPVPTGIGILVFILVIILALFNSVKKGN